MPNTDNGHAQYRKWACQFLNQFNFVADLTRNHAIFRSVTKLNWLKTGMPIYMHAHIWHVPKISIFSREKKVFRVFVIMPLLPGFEGDVGGETGTSIRIITHWNYASICR
jgi:hypothetical protein